MDVTSLNGVNGKTHSKIPVIVFKKSQRLFLEWILKTMYLTHEEEVFIRTVLQFGWYFKKDKVMLNKLRGDFLDKYEKGFEIHINTKQ